MIASIENIIDLERKRNNISYDEEINYNVNFDSLDLSPIYKQFEQQNKSIDIEFSREITTNETRRNKNEGVNRVYILIQAYPNYKTPFFAKELNTSVKNIERWIKQLKKDDKIEFIGSSRKGGYYVK